jgi:hypothetical protein
MEKYTKIDDSVPCSCTKIYIKCIYHRTKHDDIYCRQTCAGCLHIVAGYITVVASYRKVSARNYCTKAHERRQFMGKKIKKMLCIMMAAVMGLSITGVALAGTGVTS